jgi:hypothetical protein
MISTFTGLFKLVLLNVEIACLTLIPTASNQKQTHGYGIKRTHPLAQHCRGRGCLLCSPEDLLNKNVICT